MFRDNESALLQQAEKIVTAQIYMVSSTEKTKKENFLPEDLNYIGLIDMETEDFGTRTLFWDDLTVSYTAVDVFFKVPVDCFFTAYIEQEKRLVRGNLFNEEDQDF